MQAHYDTMCNVIKTVSTEQAAKSAGISRISLARWLAAGRIRPSIAIPMGGKKTLWRWTRGDINRVKRLVGKAQPGPKPKLNLKKLRTLIRTCSWKNATSTKYKACPHSYVIFFDSKTKWLWFSKQIKRFGTYRSWKGHRYKYLLLDGDCFWVDW